MIANNYANQGTSTYLRWECNENVHAEIVHSDNLGVVSGRFLEITEL